MQAFVVLEGSFSSLGYMKLGRPLQLLQAESMLNPGLVVTAAEAGKLVCAASEHESSDIFAEKCREQSQIKTWEAIVRNSLAHIITQSQHFEG